MRNISVLIKICLSHMILFVLTSCLVLSFAAYGKTINVPGDFAQIDDAITSAYDGDEIIVSPGEYESFTVYKNIIVRSTYNGDWSVVRNTIINGGILFIDGAHKQYDTCVVRGFTIRTGQIGVISTIDDNVGTHATIEYNIICDHNNEFDSVIGIGSGGSGAGIVNCDGLIQNNIIENNKSNIGAALYNCNGTIQNNTLRNNRVAPALGSTPPGIYPFRYYVSNGFGGAISSCNGTIRNNTIVDNQQRVINLTSDNSDIAGSFWKAGGLHNCKGSIVNNIIYHTTMTMPAELDACTSPSYSLFRTPRSGVGNITGDPKFIDPTNGDFHLQPDSPAIDAGKAQSGLKADPDGHQRGLKAGQPGKGDGSGMDIGAFEALPKPVAVWLPDGGPPQINDGDQLVVSWVLEPPADTSVRLRLYAGGTYLTDLGRYTPLTADAYPIQLPKPVYTRTDYTIRAISIANTQGVSYISETPAFTIFGTKKNAVPAHDWKMYQ